MPLQDIALVPGVNTTKTLLANQAGVSVSQFIRYKQGAIQKLGGWQNWFPFQVSTSPIRDIHVLQSLRGNVSWVAAAAQARLVAISCQQLLDITPQTLDTHPTPSFSTVAGSCVVWIRDPGSSATIYSGVRFDTPVAVANLLLTGAYPIAAVSTGAPNDLWAIYSSQIATATVSSGGVVPQFYIGLGQALLGVSLPNNNYAVSVGLNYPFLAPTNVAGQIIQGPYTVQRVISPTDAYFNLATPASAAVSSASPTPMNGGNAAFHYYVTQAPPPPGTAYNTGAYSSGPYSGLAIGVGITATDWTLDNWGEVIIACQKNGPIYTWAPDLGLPAAQAITFDQAPVFNLGAYVAQPQQIIMAYGSCSPTTGAQNNLIIRWCDSGAQSGYMVWGPTLQNFAGSFQIPTGSTLVAGLSTPTYQMFWTDVDVWGASFINLPLTWSFTRLGYGCGALGPHAVGQQAGVVFWAGGGNFWMQGPQGVQVLPCTVWDFFWQQIDTANQTKVRFFSNSAFNEFGWEFPILGGNSENQAYIKAHMDGLEFEWDYGFNDGSAWRDVSNVGMPLRATSGGFIVQHETSPDASGTSLNAAFETGFFVIGDGTTLAFVDWVLPDARWATLGSPSAGGTLLFTFFTTDFAGQPQRTYGPYAVTQQIPYINCRMRGRYWRCRVESQDTGSFWRIGRIKFRWAPAGMR